MTPSTQVRIDPLSASSLFVESRVNGKSLGTATGFCIEAKDRVFLVTNWHVVAGKNPVTGEFLSATGAVPDELAIVHHSSKSLGSWIVKTEHLIGPNGNPKWLEHPRGSRIDVVAVPLDTSDPNLKVYPLDLSLADFDMVVQVAMPVSIIGYPFGLATAGAWPIWKTGHLASDPDLDYDGRPAFLIDATTRGGMSGSPVILRLYGGYASSKAAMVVGGGPRTRFLGVYSGRIHGQAEIGRVWRPRVITEIISMIP